MFNKQRVVTRFIRFLRIRPDGCWEWKGALGTHGYGVIALCEKGRRRTVLAHRLGYELFRRKTRPGKQMDHLCRNRCCVNPWHLEEVSLRENVQRGEAGKKTGALNRAKTHCPKGHPYAGDNLVLTTQRKGRYQHRSCRECGRKNALATYYRRKKPAGGTAITAASK